MDFIIGKKSDLVGFGRIVDFDFWFILLDLVGLGFGQIRSDIDLWYILSDLAGFNPDLVGVAWEHRKFKYNIRSF